jgi:hypothetical protein
LTRDPATTHKPDSRRSISGPSFLFLGTGRAGSTWFFQVLREHPDVFVPPNKGTFFFTRLFDMGIEWYEAYFPREGSRRVAGEVCEDYLASAEALHRIAEYRPEMRLVCCLRNPYERAYSAWRFFARNGMDQPTLLEQARLRPDLFYFGHYATQLRLVQSLFPAEQQLVFFFEELESAPADVVRRMYEFIGVDPAFTPPSLRRPVNGSANPRSRVVARLVHQIHSHSWGRSRAVSNAVGLIKGVRTIRRLVNAALYAEPSAPSDWRRESAQFPDEVVLRYEEEISGLEQMCGRNLAHWRAPSDIVARAGKSGNAASRGQNPTAAGPLPEKREQEHTG